MESERRLIGISAIEFSPIFINIILTDYSIGNQFEKRLRFPNYLLCAISKRYEIYLDFENRIDLDSRIWFGDQKKNLLY